MGLLALAVVRLEGALQTERPPRGDRARDRTGPRGRRERFSVGAARRRATRGRGARVRERLDREFDPLWTAHPGGTLPASHGCGLAVANFPGGPSGARPGRHGDHGGATRRYLGRAPALSDLHTCGRSCGQRRVGRRDGRRNLGPGAAALRAELAPATWAAWFHGVRPVEFANDVLMLSVPSSLAAERIRSSYSGCSPTPSVT